MADGQAAADNAEPFSPASPQFEQIDESGEGFIGTGSEAVE